MYCVRNINEDTFYIGVSDRRLALFENVFPLPNGVSYNAYVIKDEKTALLDTVDRSVSERFFENLDYVLNGGRLDYLIVNHMEPDHAATMGELILRHPETMIVGNSKTLTMIGQYFDFDLEHRFITVSEGETLSLGKHTLTFAMAPMVHWPEAMVTYDAADKTLYSADAFGTFGALSGNIFADEINFEGDFLNEARRYYTNIVGKYGTQVNALLKKASGLDIETICPLHGPIWRTNLNYIINKYKLWASYTPEENSVMIAYASVYGGTENAANIVATELANLGVKNIAMYDVSKTHPSYIVSEAFRCSHLIFASTTYNSGIFCNMETALLDIKAHNLQNRTVALIDNGTWAATAGKQIKDIFAAMKNITILENTVSLKSTVKVDKKDELVLLSKAVFESMAQPAPVKDETKIEPNAMFKLSYGLFVLTARDNQKDNGCIINTVMQVTDNPKRITIAVNKANYTHDIILKTGVFNLSVLDQKVSFKMFERFGFQSGRDVDKFEGIEEVRSDNGLRYITKHVNALISGVVIKAEDMGTHTVFTADVTQAVALSNEKSVTYDYYFENIKPRPQAKEEGKKGFVCKICGYVYEGDTLPDDFICPLCKHGAEDFEPLK